MASLDYVEIPPYATRLQSAPDNDNLRAIPKVLTSLPRPEHAPAALAANTSSPTSSQPLSPSKAALNSIPQLLLSSAIQLPPTPRDATRGPLLSTRDPLSIPITTVNFRRFVSRIGPAFWLQDRLEEIVMWKKGTRYTAVWMAAYAFLCYFPRLVLLIPHICLLSVLLATHPSLRSAESAPEVPPPSTAPAGEGSGDWLANVQAIQNLMGAYSDAHDYVQPVIPHLTHATPYTPVILSATALSLVAFIPAVHLLPLRTTFLILGLAPLILTHPIVRLTLLPALLSSAQPLLTALRARLMRALDDDQLEDCHWRAELRDVELFENERWRRDEQGSAEGGWAKANLRTGERKPWTRGRDGWSGVSDDGGGDVSNLTFALSPGWKFVETEDWRPDLQGKWAAPASADAGGWVYTNDAWLDPRPLPSDEWRASGMTRRRRWIRRIYYSPMMLEDNTIDPRDI
ncbi:hypothetical protein WOLCODRAFT_136540 [Wolfiporia cocos MD-104 SS10]|uniref:TECPR1-like DysF domain-containing protein n=1 Tax=Wolfiporia cocos (strain MD-104) TaxID=742152 RepID=A0A2H3JUT1_WOLCO|nr:hypothetical protein WOLCODRAFT_136540 [Wolfiporia cocos MD-104 SS10]